MPVVNGFHGHRGDAATHQPYGHLLQIRREGRENPHRILIPAGRHGEEDFPRADIDTGCIRLEQRAIIQRHPLSFPLLFALTGRCLLFFGFLPLLVLTEHRFILFCSGNGQVAQ
jgi:hypothetical protein